MRRLSKLLTSPTFSEKRASASRTSSAENLKAVEKTELSKKDEDLEVKIGSIFDFLSGSHEANSLGGDGLIALLKSLKLGETDVEMLVLLYKFNCATLLDITRKEFIDGFKILNVTDIDGLKVEIKTATERIVKNEKEFLEFFRYVFQACREGTIKTIPKENAVYLLPICVSKSGPKYRRYIPDLCKFLESKNDSKCCFPRSKMGR
jgi:hypothetical protein